MYVLGKVKGQTQSLFVKNDFGDRYFAVMDKVMRVTSIIGPTHQQFVEYKLYLLLNKKPADFAYGLDEREMSLIATGESVGGFLGAFTAVTDAIRIYEEMEGPVEDAEQEYLQLYGESDES